MSSLSSKFKPALTFVIVASSLFLLGGGDVSAATKTWAGTEGGSTTWSNANNWSPLGAPVDGDSIVFDCALAADCASIFDIPGLTVSSVNFTGAFPGQVLNTTDAPVVVNGDISSVNPGTVFQATVVLGADITVNNVVLVNLDLNTHNITLTGKGVLNGTDRWVGVAGYIIGDGTINISVDVDQEFYLAGENYYSGITNVNSGKFVSNGQNPSAKTINMFGVSDVNVGPLGKVTFTFDETDNNLSFLNIIRFNRTNIALNQLLAVNASTNNSLVTVLFPGVVLNSDTRFDVEVSEGALSINLNGVTDNNYCIEYGEDNLQANYFINGPDCDGIPEEPNPEEPEPPVVKNPSVPKTGAVVSAVVGAATLAGLSGVGLYTRRNKSKIDTSEK